MRAALIPSKGYEHTALLSNIHLVLPFEELRNNPRYINTYEKARRRGDYIIVDNGCAEGSLVDGEELIKFAKQLRAHEIVAPDVMSDTLGTLTATLNWIEEFRKEVENYNIMAVVQATNFEDLRYLVSTYAKFDMISTLGIPKVLQEDGSTARRNTVNWILNEYPNRFKIHLLGLNGKTPLELTRVSLPRSIRSVDSTQPYKLTEQGKALTSINAWAKRREDYFTRMEYMSPTLLRRNIGTFLEWAKHNES